MKKLVIALSLIGLLAGPVTGLKATLTEKDLQKMSRHKMEDKSLQNSQDALNETCIALGTLTTFGAFATVFAAASGEPGVAAISGLATALGALGTYWTRSAWKDTVKKRMKLYGEKDFWAFVLRDRMSRKPRVSYHYNSHHHHHHGHHHARGW